MQIKGLHIGPISIIIRIEGLMSEQRDRKKWNVWFFKKRCSIIRKSFLLRNVPAIIFQLESPKLPRLISSETVNSSILKRTSLPNKFGIPCLNENAISGYSVPTISFSPFLIMYFCLNRYCSFNSKSDTLCGSKGGGSGNKVNSSNVSIDSKNS